MKNEINLLHTKAKSPLGSLASKVNILRTIAVFLLFLVSLLSVAFFFLVLVSPLPSLRREENAKKASLRTLYGKITNLYIINDRTSAFTSVITNRGNIDTVISVLLDNLPAEVTVQALKISEKEIFIDISSNSLIAIQSYIDALVQTNTEKKTFSSILQSDLTVSQTGGGIKVHIAFTK